MFVSVSAHFVKRTSKLYAKLQLKTSNCQSVNLLDSLINASGIRANAIKDLSKRYFASLRNKFFYALLYYKHVETR